MDSRYMTADGAPIPQPCACDGGPVFLSGDEYATRGSASQGYWWVLYCETHHAVIAQSEVCYVSKLAAVEALIEHEKTTFGWIPVGFYSDETVDHQDWAGVILPDEDAA